MKLREINILHPNTRLDKPSDDQFRDIVKDNFTTVENEVNGATQRVTDLIASLPYPKINAAATDGAGQILIGTTGTVAFVLDVTKIHVLVNGIDSPIGSTDVQIAGSALLILDTAPQVGDEIFVSIDAGSGMINQYGFELLPVVEYPVANNVIGGE